jgi:hypothetical protein
MLLKFKFGNGGEFHGSPYTKQEEVELHRQIATGPTGIDHSAGRLGSIW